MLFRSALSLSLSPSLSLFLSLSLSLSLLFIPHLFHHPPYGVKYLLNKHQQCSLRSSFTCHFFLSLFFFLIQKYVTLIALYPFLLLYCYACNQHDGVCCVCAFDVVIDHQFVLTTLESPPPPSPTQPILFKTSWVRNAPTDGDR